MALTLSGTNGVVGAGFTVDASGVSVTAGVGTFGSLAAPAAGLTGALPAISAASLTQIPAANIVGVCTAGLANASGVLAGVTEVDMWRVTSNFDASGAGAYITSNWERNDTTGFSKKGTGLSESSGVFSFPSTGIYQIDATLMSKNDSNTNRYAECQIFYTINNSSYVEQTSASGGVGSQYGHNTFRASAIVDVTDTSQCFFKIRQYTYNSNTVIVGSSSASASYILVKRLGDT